MSKQYIRIEHLSLVRAFALAGAMAALPACGASAGGPITSTRADSGTTSTPDAGSTTTPPPASPASRCAAMCANARAANCGPYNEGCVAACQAFANGLPARCSAQTGAYFTCAASARFTCADDGAEVQGCDAQAAALDACTSGEEPTSDAGAEPAPSDRCLPDSAIPDDIAATICTSVPATPVPHDCPGGAPSDDCVASPGGEANVFCCAR